MFYKKLLDTLFCRAQSSKREVAMATKNEFLEEAAVILEQEGWLISRYARDTGSNRLRRFAERVDKWQDAVDAFRLVQPDEWPRPPDNS